MPLHAAAKDCIRKQAYGTEDCVENLSPKKLKMDCIATTSEVNGNQPNGVLNSENVSHDKCEDSNIEGSGLKHVAKAWEHWKLLGQPKLIVAPMVDQSELPFRMLCRKYGAEAAYTPMFHSRLFVEDMKYRNAEFTTCKEDRPLFVQFCANNPDTLLSAAKLAEPFCDYIDINLGCPQRIAKRGRYGAFLMDELPLVQSLVSKLASNLTVPVSCKIRIFPSLEETVSYAQMLEAAGCSLLAVHGRTREHKCSRAVRADWNAIKAVKAAVKIPVLANGNIRNLDDIDACIKETGVDGVLSAESLLENPALFAGFSVSLPRDTSEENCTSTSTDKIIDPPVLLLEYLDLCEKYVVPPRIVRAHVHRILGNWFRVHNDLREQLNRETKFTFEWLRDLIKQLMERNGTAADGQMILKSANS